MTRLEKAECGGNAAGHADHAEGVTEAGRGLGRQAAQRPDAAERGGQVRHLVDLGVALAHRPAVGGQEGGSRHPHQVVVLWGIRRSLEHVQHPTRNKSS